MIFVNGRLTKNHYAMKRKEESNALYLKRHSKCQYLTCLVKPTFVCLFHDEVNIMDVEACIRKSFFPDQVILMKEMVLSVGYVWYDNKTTVCGSLWYWFGVCISTHTIWMSILPYCAFI